MISFLFNYQPWSKDFEALTRTEAKKIILRDVNPQFIALELLNFLQVQKIIRPARYSKKYFKKGKGVVAYTMLSNHIPLQTELIGAHEHESYFVFDIWYNNTAEVVSDVVTGDMHCINKGNFVIIDWFGGKLCSLKMNG